MDLGLSERLHRLFQSLPFEVRSSHLARREPSPAQAELTAIMIVDFLYLMHSAHTLYTSGYFSGRLWKQMRWQAEQALCPPVFRAHLPQVRGEFASSPAFLAFVEVSQQADDRSRPRAGKKQRG